MTAARLWASVLAAELMLALIVGSICAGLWSIPVRLAFMAGLGALLSVYLGGIGASFLLASIVGREAAARADKRRPLQALLTELVWFGLAQLQMIAEPDCRSARKRPVGRAPESRPVMLLHGFACNQGLFRRLRAHLLVRGYGPVHAIDLQSLNADMDFHCATAARALQDMQAGGSPKPVVVIGHSMGGLVARGMLRLVDPGLIHQIVTVATPHHGTEMAHLVKCSAARQMLPGSAWLQVLNDTQEGKLILPLTSIFSLDDNIVAPPRSAALHGAQLKSLNGLGHFGLIGARRALDAIVATLQSAHSLPVKP